MKVGCCSPGGGGSVGADCAVTLSRQDAGVPCGAPAFCRLTSEDLPAERQLWTRERRRTLRIVGVPSGGLSPPTPFPLPAVRPAGIGRHIRESVAARRFPNRRNVCSAANVATEPPACSERAGKPARRRTISRAIGRGATNRSSQTARTTTDRAPSPGGEGWGEGERGLRRFHRAEF